MHLWPCTLTFMLSFIPNIGLAISVLLPMPVVLLDPDLSAASVACAFFGPVAVGMVAKDVDLYNDEIIEGAVKNQGARPIGRGRLGLASFVGIGFLARCDLA